MILLLCQDCIDGILTLSNPDRLIAGCVNISSVCVRDEFCKSWYLLLGVWDLEGWKRASRALLMMLYNSVLQLISMFLLGISGVGGLALVSGPNITTFFICLGRNCCAFENFNAAKSMKF